MNKKISGERLRSKTMKKVRKSLRFKVKRVTNISKHVNVSMKILDDPAKTFKFFGELFQLKMSKYL